MFAFTSLFQTNTTICQLEPVRRDSIRIQDFVPSIKQSQVGTSSTYLSPFMDSHSSTSGASSTRAASRITDAPKPFDKSSISDVILRSCDSVDFFVLQSLLCFVSPVFNDALSVAALETKNGVPIVTVSEDSETLACLLTLIYPHDREPQVASAPLFSKVCRAARKYSMDVIIRKLRAMLSRVEPSHSPDTIVAHHFLLYAIAVQFEWHAEAAKAARHTLSTPWRKMPYNDELRNISGADFCQYLALREGFKEKPLPPITPVTKAKKEERFAAAEKPFDSSAKADVILRSTDQIDFYVLGDLLSLVTPVFDSVSSTRQKDGLSVLDFEEDGATLRHLLSLIYPCAESQIDDFDTFVKVARAARKYGMNVVGDKLKHQLDVSRHIVDDPVRTLWVAIAFGWGQVAKKAAKNALALPVGGAVISSEEELSLVTGADVYWFIQYRLACCDAACEAVLKDRLFAPDKTKEKETVVQRFVDRLKESPRGISIGHACASEIQETSKAGSEYRAKLLFKLLKQRDKLVTVVEDAISKVQSYPMCQTNHRADILRCPGSPPH